MQTAREFYGKNYDLAPNQTKLDEAHKWLVKGCEFVGKILMGHRATLVCISHTRKSVRYAPRCQPAREAGRQGPQSRD